MYRSYSVSNMPQPIDVTEEKPRKHEPPTQRKPEKKQELPVISDLQSDDLILLIVIAMLIFNECNDKLLLLALVYIFFSDYFMRGNEKQH